jgi:hypothetical protein
MSRIKDWIESQIEWKRETDSLDDPDMMVDPALEDENGSTPQEPVGGSGEPRDSEQTANVHQ